MSGSGGSAMRLRALVRKELIQVVRDPSSIAIALVLPVLLLLLFGYGVSLDPRDVPVALVLEDRGADAASLAARFRLSRYFDARTATSLPEAERWLLAREVDGVIRLPSDFARRLRQGDTAAIQILVNGVDANRAGLIAGYAGGAWRNWLAQRAAQGETALAPPVQVESRLWFNRAARSRNFLVPGLIALIMTLIGALLTALVMAREWERGTLEGILATPIRVREVLLGKMVPYFLLGMGGMGVSVLMAVFLFGVPLRSSLGVLVGGSALFLLAALGMGLFISAVTRNQFLAALTAIITTFLPAFILSGFLFDIGSMPAPIRLITRLVAARYFVALLQTTFLAGNVWSVILPNAAALALLATVFLVLTRRKTTKRLEA